MWGCKNAQFWNLLLLELRTGARSIVIYLGGKGRMQKAQFLEGAAAEIRKRSEKSVFPRKRAMNSMERNLY